MLELRKMCHDETGRRVLRGAGYRFLHSRKRGLLKKDDLKKRRNFTRKVTKMLTDKCWEEDISFYIDAAGFEQSITLTTRSGPYELCHGNQKMKAYTLTAVLKDLTWTRGKSSAFHCGNST